MNSNKHNVGERIRADKALGNRAAKVKGKISRRDGITNEEYKTEPTNL